MPTGGYLGVVARKPIDCKLRLDGMPVRSETVLTEAGPVTRAAQDATHALIEREIEADRREAAVSSRP